MKKRIVSTILTMVMGFSMCTMGGNPTQVQAAGIVMEYQDINSDQASKASVIKPGILQKESDIDTVMNHAYMVTVTNDEEKSITIPVKVTADGKLNYVISSDNENSSGTATYILSKDSAGKNVIATGSQNLQSTNTYDNMEKLSKGTYYLTIKMDGNILEDGLFYIQACIYKIGNQVLTNNVPIISASNGKAATYYKITVSKPSTLAFQFAGFDSLTGKVTLCDKNKKVISATSVIGKTEDQGVQTYVVNKGTYYYKVTTTNSAYIVQSNASSYTDTAGKTVAKAKALSLNKEIKGYVSLADKKGTIDYYKLTTKKANSLKGLYVGYYGQGTIQVSIKIPGYKTATAKLTSGDLYHIDSLYETVTTGSGTYYRDKVFPKGTYTIQIKKLTAKTNGTCYIGTKLYQE